MEGGTDGGGLEGTEEGGKGAKEEEKEEDEYSTVGCERFCVSVTGNLEETKRLGQTY